VFVSAVWCGLAVLGVAGLLELRTNTKKHERELKSAIPNPKFRWDSGTNGTRAKPFVFNNHFLELVPAWDKMGQFSNRSHFMKIVISILLLLLGAVSAFPQSDLQKLVDTEKAFAAYAAERSTKQAFLEFLADDGVVFNPDRQNGKEVWRARAENTALLSWYPAVADISSSGLIGYTTGPWEYRPKGKTDAPAAFGQYSTVWQKQQNGEFKAVLDMGVTHGKNAASEAPWTAPVDLKRDKNEKNSYAGDTAAMFFSMMREGNEEKAYKAFAADDIRMLRNGKFPITGKKAVLGEVKKDQSKLEIARRISFFGSGDLAYVTNTYSRTDKDNKVEKGNFMQVWKLRDDRWQIVLDVFNPLPK
jgi:ketosteroid isomerase-like protein